MKSKIHPKYVDAVVKCGCGHSFTTRSTKADIHIEICSNCHPFFTGQQKFVDTLGRVQRFQQKFGGEYFKQAAKKAGRKTRR
ncbi:MAG: 50S ribosomal protein L31 [Planctomycetes bacterium]|nr:50S ribosomal protein L31 [Planctomycetota bacterium]